MLKAFTSWAEAFLSVIRQQSLLLREEAQLSLISAKWFCVLIVCFTLLLISSWLTFLVTLGLAINQLLNNVLVVSSILLILQLLMLVCMIYLAKKLIQFMSFKESRKKINTLFSETMPFSKQESMHQNSSKNEFASEGKS